MHLSPIRWLERLLPPEVRDGDPEQRRLATLVLLFTLVIEAPGPVFVPLDLEEGKFGLAAFVSALCVAFLGVVPVLWWTRSAGAATQYLLALFVGLLVSIAGVTGGLGSTALFMLTAVPLIGLMGGGPWWGRRWLALVATMPLGFAVLGAAGVLFPVTDSAVEVEVTNILAMLANFCVVFGIATVFDGAQRRAHAEIEAREGDIRRILDHVGQGFLTVRRSGEIVGPSSAVLSAWIAAPQPGQTLAALLSGSDPAAAGSLQLGFDALVDGFLPDEVIFDQLPKRIRAGARVLGLELRPIPASTDLLLILSDLTATLARERSDEVQREMVEVVDRALQDPRGLDLLLQEGAAAVARLQQGAGADALRLVHTVKGSAGLFGAGSVARLCHVIESRLVDDEGAGGPSDDEVRELAETWSAFAERASLLVRRRDGVVEVPRSAFDLLRADLAAGATRDAVLERIDQWDLDPADRSFARLADHALAVADRLGKPIEIQVQPGAGTARELAPFWSVAVHLVRNAVDHGIEAPAERERAGKPAAGQIRMSSEREAGGVVVRIADDGPGVDWDAVARSAKGRGIPCDTSAALVDALFADQVTSRVEVSDLSGRGVGLAAVREVVVGLGGTIAVTSVAGRGTRFEVWLPSGGPVGAGTTGEAASA